MSTKPSYPKVRPSPFSGSRPVRVLAATLFFLTLALPLDATSAAAEQPSQEVVTHEKDGPFVRFALTERPAALSLQGLVPGSGRWVTLASRKKPSATLSRLKIPPRWRKSEIRVLATYSLKPSLRTEIPSMHDPETRGVTFVTTSGARLFSVEAKEAGKSAWKRVSTVAAPSTPTSVRVALPSSLPENVSVRVMAVTGPRKTRPPLETPLSTSLRRGPANFSATLEAVSSQPVLSQKADVASSLTGSAKNALPSAEESDVWRIHGNRIYFFNRLRGLQVVNASDRGKPTISGHLSMAGVGEEMYVLGPSSGPATSAILLTALPWSPEQPGGTRVSRISFAGDAPEFDSSLDLLGDYVESRMVGGLLHVVTRSGSWDNAKNEWISKTFVNSIDLSSNKSLVNSSRELTFEAAVVGSTAKYLWVAGSSPSDGWRHRLVAFGFKTDGSLANPIQSDLGGQVQDKFKVGDTSEGLAVVVQSWASPDWVQETSVETYRDERGVALVRDAQLDVVSGESLFASRFDGDLLYAVTFEQIDPLWIIDLSDPSKPVIKGHLEVPRWSSFIQPMGDVLLAVGRDGGKVQVSMFDVSDPSKPSLAQRVDVGEGWSWSEAEWNEKAVKILPAAGLILVPVVEANGGSRSNRINLVEFDVAARTLVKRGTINHAFEPRRATLMEGNTIASLSNRELLLVDASNRDLPSVTAELVLARAVDRIVLHDGTAFLFENGEGEWSGSDRKATLRTSSSGDLENILAEIPLPCEEVAAAAVFGDRLVLVERSFATRWRLKTSFDVDEPADKRQVSVWSLDDPTKASLISRIDLPMSVNGEVDLLPVEGGRVAVVSRDRGTMCYVRALPAAGIPAAADAAMPAVARIAPPWMGWGNQSLQIAIAQIDGATPSIVGKWDLSGEQYTDVSKVFSAGDLMVFSFAAREQDMSSSPDDLWSNWRTRHWLLILDLADVSAPMPWAPVQLPGELVGISWLQRGGGMLFARSDDRIAALGFDGENASVIAEVPVTSAICLQGSSLYHAYDKGIAEWKFSEAKSKWIKQAGWKFSGGDAIYQLSVAEGALLAGGYNQAWVLGEDGSIQSKVMPWGADLGAAASDGNLILVPGGEYGALPLR